MEQYLRLNGDGSSTTDYDCKTNGSATTGAAEFQVLNVSGGEVIPIEATIISKTVERAIDIAGVYVRSGDFASGYVNGRYDPGGPIIAIELYGDKDATGAAALYGYDYP